MAYEVAKVTGKIIKELYADGHPNKAALQSLRSAATMTSPRAQPVWSIMISSLDDNMLSRSENGTPTYAEIAIYAAIRMYAIHQQGIEPIMYERSDSDNDGLKVFAALAQTKANLKNSQALDARVQAVLATTNIDSAINSLTHLISIMKANKSMIKIDYADLAQNLFRYQFSFEQANSVRLGWGETYFRRTAIKTDKTNLKGTK